MNTLTERLARVVAQKEEAKRANLVCARGHYVRREGCFFCNRMLERRYGQTQPHAVHGERVHDGYCYECQVWLWPTNRNAKEMAEE